MVSIIKALPMNNTFTQEITLMEQEASWWLAVYENIPDEAFIQVERKPSELVVQKVKGFSKALTTITFLNHTESVLIN